MFTKLRLCKTKSRGGKVKKIGAAVPILFLPTLFRKRAGAPARHDVVVMMNLNYYLSEI